MHLPAARRDVVASCNKTSAESGPHDLEAALRLLPDFSTSFLFSPPFHSDSNVLHPSRDCDRVLHNANHEYTQHSAVKRLRHHHGDVFLPTGTYLLDKHPIRLPLQTGLRSQHRRYWLLHADFASAEVSMGFANLIRPTEAVTQTNSAYASVLSLAVTLQVLESNAMDIDDPQMTTDCSGVVGAPAANTHVTEYASTLCQAAMRQAVPESSATSDTEMTMSLSEAVSVSAQLFRTTEYGLGEVLQPIADHDSKTQPLRQEVLRANSHWRFSNTSTISLVESI